MTTEEIKASIVAWKNMIMKDHRYYFPKAMDIFYSWPISHKREFLHFVTDRHENPEWAKDNRLDDETLYPDVLRCMLNCYTGTDKEHQFYKRKFARFLQDYQKSDAFVRAEANISEDSENFTEALELI